MSSSAFSAGSIVIFMMFMVYMLLGTLLESKGSFFGHESGAVILIGMAISMTSMASGHDEFNHMMTFDENFFFYFCLPPIVFASGYNMKRRMFFKNITNILILGLFNTILQFTLFSVFTYIFVEFGTMTKFDPETE